MTEVIEKPIFITFKLEQCLRSFRETKKRVLTVALVTERVDRFKTIINPEGCLTDFSNVVVDFRHSKVNTGAKLLNKRIETVTLDNGEKVRALVGDIEVYADSFLRLKDSNGKTFEDGNALEAIENGRIMSVSVDFEPTETWINEETNIIEYRKWSLRRLSLLDTVPGQEDSMILNIRSLNNLTNLKNNFMCNKGDKIRVNMPVEVADVIETDGKTMYKLISENGNEINIDEEQLRAILVDESEKETEKPMENSEEENKREGTSITIEDVKNIIDEAIKPIIEVLKTDIEEDIAETETETTKLETRTDETVIEENKGVENEQTEENKDKEEAKNIRAIAEQIESQTVEITEGEASEPSDPSSGIDEVSNAENSENKRMAVSSDLWIRKITSGRF